MKSKFSLIATLSLLALTPTLAAAEVPSVRTAKAVPAAAVSELSALGRTAPAQQAHLFSRVTGTISESKVDIGDRVKSGDVLAVIEAPEIAHKIAAARAKIAQMTTRTELATALLKRAESLAEDDAISSEELDERRSATQAAKADLLAATAELNGIEETEGFLTIRAPFDGTIIARRIARGDHVNGDNASPDAWLFHITRLNELRMVLHVPPGTALQIRNGQQADVQFTDIPGHIFSAHGGRFSSLIEAQTGTMQVELSLPNADFAVPAGLSGTAKIKAESVNSALLIPINAVAARDGVSQVALVEDGRVKFSGVKTGRTLGPKIEILSGLKPGGEVILCPNALLRDGDAVEPVPMDEAKKGG
ncbi:MAG: efflux RND transporter periplasmic adaptor subunit [Akkermansiaceae bacterium]